MKLKDHFQDAERYLAQDCYCPGEVYSADGFFYEIFSADDWFSPLGKGEAIYELPEIAHAETTFGICRDQLLFVTTCSIGEDGEEKILEMLRLPINPNNVSWAYEMLMTGDSDRTVELEENTLASLRKVMSMADAVICD